MPPHEIGVFVRTSGQLRRARAAAKTAGAAAVELSDKIEMTQGRISISAMHLAKGLKFRAVAVMACDDDVIPLQERIESVATKPISKKCTTPSATCSMSPAPDPATICS